MEQIYLPDIKSVQKFQKVHRWWLKPQCNISIWPGHILLFRRARSLVMYFNIWNYDGGTVMRENLYEIQLKNQSLDQDLSKGFEKALLNLDEKGIGYSFIDKKEIASVKREPLREPLEEALINVLFTIPIEQMLTSDNELIRSISLKRLEEQEKLKHVPQQSPR